MPCGSRTVGFNVTMTVAFIISHPFGKWGNRSTSPFSLLKNSFKDPIDVCEQSGRIENAIDVRSGQGSLDVGIRLNLILERAALVPHAHRVALYPSVRIFTSYVLRH